MANGLLETDYTFAKKKQVLVEVAFEETPGSGTPGDFMPAGCFSGDINHNDSTAEVMDDIQNWCIAQEGKLITGTDGDRDYQIGFTLEVIIGSLAFQKLLENRETRDAPSWWKFTRTDGSTPVNTWEQELRCRINQWNTTDSEESTSQVAVNLRVNEIINNEITPGA